MASSWKDLTIRKTEKKLRAMLFQLFPSFCYLIFLVSDLQVGLHIWKIWFCPFEIFEYYFFITKFSLSISILKETVSRKWSWFDWLTQKYYSSSGLHYEMGSKSLFVFPKAKYTCEISVDSISISGALSFSPWEPHAVSLPSRPSESFGIFKISNSVSKHILEFNQGTWSLFCRLQTMNSFPNF